MRIFCLDYSHSNESPKSRIFKQKPGTRSLDDLAESGAGEIADFYLPDVGEGAPGGGNPLERISREVRAKQEAKKETQRKIEENVPRPVTPKAKEKLKQRTISEIFGDPETQRHYIEGVRESLEKLDPDRLHDFIMAHRKYGKSGFVAWNRDLDALLAFTPEAKYRGKNKRHTQRRICAAMQHVLVDFYNTDVFQITKKKINPWIFIDGKLGPYSVSVLAEYWNSKHGSTSKKKPNPLGDSGLDHKSYKRGGRSHNSYQAALRWKEAQIRRSDTEREKRRLPGDPAERLSKKVRDRYRRLDRAGSTLTPSDLETSYLYDYEDPQPLSAAVAEAYGEDPTNAVQSPQTFRLLRLLADKMGADMESIRIAGGDRIEVKGGVFTVTDRNGTQKHKVTLS